MRVIERRRMWLLSAVAVSLPLAVGGAVGWWPDRDVAYASLRQAAAESIPGTLGVRLEAPPETFTPAIAPAHAARLGARGASHAEAILTLAVVRDEFSAPSSTDARPAWVVITRAQCFASFKGELVAASRHPEKQGRCTRANLWIEVVDAASGERLYGLRGYDESKRWEPETRG
jgi:hypothetical protein